ncbi:S24 family peptidase [Undibacterium sp. SXout7W]|uniref:S24 family peptidase n=1 Tax=Undibacterium sp. SXout7W TaxID=3413049 RepID=UPI003BF237C8
MATVEKRELTPEERSAAERLKFAWTKFKENNRDSGGKPYTQEWVATETQLGSQSLIGQYLNGIIPLNVKALMSISNLIGVSPYDISKEIMEHIGDTPARIVAAKNDNYVRIERLNVVAQGGYGSVAPEEIEVVDRLEVTREFVRDKLQGLSPDQLKIITAKGHSMRGQVEDGDLLFVQPTNVFTQDGLYVISVSGLVRVKRLRLSLKEKLVFVESNDGSAPETFRTEELEGLNIQAKVIAAWNLRYF